MKKIKPILAIVLILCMSICLLCACKKETKEEKETTTMEEPSTHAPENVLMKLAGDDAFRHAFRDAFDTYTDGGELGSMNYDYRDENCQKQLLSCMYGAKACVDYSLYPVEQPTDDGVSVYVSADSVKWVAINIFHCDEKVVDKFIKNCPDCSNNIFSKKTEKDENGVVWYYSNSLVKDAMDDGLYNYVQINRIHNDPSEKGRNGGTYNLDYYGVFAKEKIDGKEYWTMYTHGSGTYTTLISIPSLEPDIYFPEEKEMLVTEDGVSFRQGPGKEYKVITAYNAGILVNAIGTKGEWVYCHYYDNYGWIHSSLLKDR